MLLPRYKNQVPPVAFLSLIHILLIAIGVLWVQIPAEMAPMEDRSQISINTRAAEGASYEYIRDYTEEMCIRDSIGTDEVKKDLEGKVTLLSGNSGVGKSTLMHVLPQSQNISR